MRFLRYIFLLAVFSLGTLSCLREDFETMEDCVPEGQPVTLYLGFDSLDQVDVQVGTKAEASRVDESRIHDLYVLIFDKSGDKFYGRHFSYEHLISKLTDLVNNNKNEGWYVDNVTVDNVNSNNESERNKLTKGVVKISTESKPDCSLFVLANLSNTVSSLDGQGALERLTQIKTLEELRQVKVQLEQNVVNRNDLFLMLGSLSPVNTGDMRWGTNPGGNPPSYNTTYRVPLVKMDAKVKFRITYDTGNISSVTARYWQACKLPQWTYLLPREISGDYVRDVRDPEDYFDAQQAYFEGKETEGGKTYDVFTFYMLENRQNAKKSVNAPDVEETGYSRYYLRELQQKTADPDHAGSVVNGDWIFARKEASYVKFDLVLDLTETGILNLGETDKAAALTSEALFTVHLGDFTSSAGGDFDNYRTERGYFYTYDITVNNSKSIYVEVRGSDGEGANRVEKEPGHEGSLLLTTNGLINCDSHYEYHSIDFKYDSTLGSDNDSNPHAKWPVRKKVSWYVKTPFYYGGANFNEDTGLYEMPAGADLHPDYQWIFFSLNKMEGGNYLTARKNYPGFNDTDKRSNYDPDWVPDDSGDVPVLMDVNQLINFIFVQNRLKYLDQSNLFDTDGYIRLTAYVNEYYYETDPRTYKKHATKNTTYPWTGETNQNLWREFVNAKPRELHILSNTLISEDRKSDVIVSSHSIIQQSIQTIYNIYAPDLTSLWGVEHKDELEWKHLGGNGWRWWKGTNSTGALPAGAYIYNDDENGRLNTAGMWGLTTGTEQQWADYMAFEVENDIPELKEDNFYQAYSCMARNRDNNGDGIIDQDEIRWYTASINQLVGLWIGKEALSQTARLYQPIDETVTGDSAADQEKWRSLTVSSTLIGGNSTTMGEPRIIRAEEGATKSNYNMTFDNFTISVRDKVSSVRCVRNIGTYQDQGTTKDITYAPYDIFVDQYYDFEQGQDQNGKAWPNSDGSYTLRFSRLNSKAIREYTAEDLPYSDENSMNDRVYLRLTAQPKDEKGTNTNYGKQRVMNANVTVHNDYCPPGYRVPNMTELLTMVALLPTNYWTAGKLYPCRSFFSRGYLGTRKTTGETKKIGWAFNESQFRVFLQNENQSCSDLRCVRDDNMIGDITGRITVTDPDHRRTGENMDLDLYFTSMASVIQSVTLKVCYTDAEGNKREIELSNDGLQLHGTELRQTITRLLPASIPVYGFMTVRAIVRNAAGIERTFEAPIRVVSELYASLKLLPCEYDGNPATKFPILATASHIDEPVTRWVLRITNPDKRTERKTISLSGTPTYSSTIYLYDPGTLKTGTYTFQLEAVCDGKTTRSEEVSMDVLQVNYQPVPQSVIDDSYASVQDMMAAVNSYQWKREMVQDLDFARGDFIETDMDVSRCIFLAGFTAVSISAAEIKTNIEQHGYVYFRNTGGSNYVLLDVDYLEAHPDETYYYLDTSKSVGLDNLISFGLSDVNWTDWSLHAFYPAVPSGQTTGELLRFNPVWNGDYAGTNYAVAPHDRPIHIRLNKDGLYWNNKLMDINQFAEGSRNNVREVLQRLTNAKTLYVGSVGGGSPAHGSRAVYRFVRVVYNGQYSTTSNSNTDFRDDPVFGGNL